jgi:hypothetical protein
VSIESLKALSKSNKDKLNSTVKENKEITKIIIVKKYLLISEKSKFILVKINLFMKIFFGLLKDKI